MKIDSKKKLHSSTSIIISAYNQANALKIIFDSFKLYPPPVSEIIIADDGSSDGTSELINTVKKEFSFPIHHVFQEDKGFRKAKILNKAILKSTGSHLIFIDGDTIPFPNTIKHHINASSATGYSVGSKIHLSDEESFYIMHHGFDESIFEKKLLSKRFALCYQQLKNILYILTRKRTRPKFYGCNFSVDRNVLLSVNGFDMRYEGFGWEDSDLRNRLNNAGAKPCSLWVSAPVLHISHQIDKGRTIANCEKGRDIKKPEIYNQSKNKVHAQLGIIALD